MTRKKTPDQKLVPHTAPLRPSTLEQIHELARTLGVTPSTAHRLMVEESPSDPERYRRRLLKEQRAAKSDGNSKKSDGNSGPRALVVTNHITDEGMDRLVAEARPIGESPIGESPIISLDEHRSRWSLVNRYRMNADIPRPLRAAS